jgi:hypothetical protein
MVLLVIKAGLLYFALVFGVGFALGPIRILWLVPAVGVMWAELIEVPIMLAVILFAARWVVKRLAVPGIASARAGVGCFALALLLAVEFTFVLGLRGMSLSDYIANRDPVSGTVYVLLLAVFAAAPVWSGKVRG